jgi:hypothetical protein
MTANDYSGLHCGPREDDASIQPLFWRRHYHATSNDVRLGVIDGVAGSGRSGVGAWQTEGLLLRYALLCSRELPQCVPASALLPPEELLQAAELL